MGSIVVAPGLEHITGLRGGQTPRVRPPRQAQVRIGHLALAGCALHPLDVPRKPRVETPNGVHDAVARGNGGAAIVLDDTDRHRFLERLARAFERHGWLCFAYCLLDNHFHLVVRTPEPNLGVGMQWLKAAYAQDFSFRHERRGHLFGGRYYAELVEREEHLLSAIAYVALNPVRAGLVDRPEDWRWSSYAATIGLASAPCALDCGQTLELFGPNRDRARAG